MSEPWFVPVGPGVAVSSTGVGPGEPMGSRSVVAMLLDAVKKAGTCTWWW